MSNVSTFLDSNRTQIPDWGIALCEAIIADAEGGTTLPVPTPNPLPDVPPVPSPEPTPEPSPTPTPEPSPLPSGGASGGVDADAIKTILDENRAVMPPWAISLCESLAGIASAPTPEPGA